MNKQVIRRSVAERQATGGSMSLSNTPTDSHINNIYCGCDCCGAYFQYVNKQIISGKVWMVTLKWNKTDRPYFKEDYDKVLRKYSCKGEILVMGYEVDSLDKLHMHFLWSPDKLHQWVNWIPKGMRATQVKARDSGAIWYCIKASYGQAEEQEQRLTEHFFRQTYAF